MSIFSVFPSELIFSVYKFVDSLLHIAEVARWRKIVKNLRSIIVLRYGMGRNQGGKGYDSRLAHVSYSVVIISTDGSLDVDGVIAGDDGGCFRMPGLPTVFFSTISMLVNADDTWKRFSISVE